MKNEQGYPGFVIEIPKDEKIRANFFDYLKKHGYNVRFVSNIESADCVRLFDGMATCDFKERYVQRGCLIFRLSDWKNLTPPLVIGGCPVEDSDITYYSVKIGDILIHIDQIKELLRRMEEK